MVDWQEADCQEASFDMIVLSIVVRLGVGPRLKQNPRNTSHATHQQHKGKMSIADKLHLLRPSNGIYLFNLTLVLLFLILPAITGPGSKIWWMTISYSTPGASGPGAGSEWKMGGLGVCKSGEECIGAGSALAPAVSGQIKSALMYHFAGMSPVLD